MRKKRTRQILCSIAGENIHGALKQKFTISFGENPRYFVECDQEDCQYVGENRPPCPLNLDMFLEELSSIKEKRMDRNAGL